MLERRQKLKSLVLPLLSQLPLTTDIEIGIASDLLLLPCTVCQCYLFHPFSYSNPPISSIQHRLPRSHRSPPSTRSECQLTDEVTSHNLLIKSFK